MNDCATPSAGHTWCLLLQSTHSWSCRQEIWLFNRQSHNLFDFHRLSAKAARQTTRKYIFFNKNANITYKKLQRIYFVLYISADIKPQKNKKYKSNNYALPYTFISDYWRQINRVRRVSYCISSSGISVNCPVCRPVEISRNWLNSKSIFIIIWCSQG